MKWYLKPCLSNKLRSAYTSMHSVQPSLFPLTEYTSISDIFTGIYNFCSDLFATLNDTALPKWGLLLYYGRVQS